MFIGRVVLYFYRFLFYRVPLIPRNAEMEHTIELLRHRRQLLRRIEVLESEHTIIGLEDFPIFTPLQKAEFVPLSHKPTPTTLLDKTMVQKVLCEGTSVLLVHAGFTRELINPYTNCDLSYKKHGVKHMYMNIYIHCRCHDRSCRDFVERAPKFPSNDDWKTQIGSFSYYYGSHTWFFCKKLFIPLLNR